ncbi:hypothetical protein BKA69DRAFT_1126627 [Paraphysoderma sedebokerense]|nr:hypothetical protein BKA69DRAFT_1126627 [Paraphysoderma sedebokerense]
MHFQSIIVVAVVALLAGSDAAPSPAPLPGFIVDTVVTTGIWEVVRGWHTRNKQRDARVDWLAPHEKTVWECGKNVTIRVNTLMIGSSSGLGATKFSLHYGDKDLGPVAGAMTAKWLKTDRTLKFGRARNGKGELEWAIPEELPTGDYRLEFEQSTFNTHRTRFRHLSPFFKINCIPPEKFSETVNANKSKSSTAKTSSSSATGASSTNNQQKSSTTKISSVSDNANTQQKSSTKQIPAVSDDASENIES